jgi:hypothetical protein
MKVFAGKAWEGIDAHYRARHEQERGVRYEDWWSFMCEEHRG